MNEKDVSEKFFNISIVAFVTMCLLMVAILFTAMGLELFCHSRAGKYFDVCKERTL